MKKITLLFLLLPFLGWSQVQIGQTMYGNVTNENFGKEPAFSADNTRMVILDNISGANSIIGHAKVFDFINNTWSQVGQTLEFSALGPLHQSDASISADGNIIAIASIGNSPTAVQSGSIKVYQMIENNWVQIGQEIFPLTIGEFFAEKICLSSDGTTLAAGAPRFDNGLQNIGYVRVFKYINNEWEIKGSMLEGSVEHSGFGTDVSLSLDGNTLVCSAPSGVNAPGYLKIFEYLNDNWVETGIINEVLSSERIGYRVILTPNAETIALSTTGSDFGSLTGQVRVYEKVINSWVQKGSGFSGLESLDFLGEQIAISDDGTILAIGAPRHDFDGEDMGYINLYKYVNNDWVLFGNQIRGISNNDNVGRSFVLSPDGTLLGVGYIYDDTNATNSGKMITYDLTSALSIDEYTTNLFTIYPNPTINQFTIQLDTTVELEKVSIYNTLGQVVLTSEENIINTSKLSSGSYNVEILTNKGKSSKQLIIE